MTIDTYAICPCGSGKKIKFCKCKDSVHELDRVLKMIEGGQLVPALDRLGQILQEHPDAAWALAIRGRLLMDLREYQSLAENAERFTRLQPSNPLALTQRAAAALFQQDVRQATGLMLEALTESGQSVDTFVLDVASLVSYALAGNGIPLTARVYAMLALVSSNYEDTRLANSVLQQLNGDPQINLLAKSMPELIPRPSGATWGERFDEAASLLNNNKVALAQTKFESLQRTAPMQPSVLSGLLQCAIWQGDHVLQSDLLKKLSQCEELPMEERVVNLAMSMVVSPESDPLTIPVKRLFAEVESIDEPLMALSASSRFADLPAETLKSLKDDSGIPPRAGYHVIDREPPADDAELSADVLPTALGLLLVHGRQTDRAPLIEVVGLTDQREAAVRPLLDETLGAISWQSEVNGDLPLVEATRPQLAGLKVKREQLPTFEVARAEFMGAWLRKSLTQTPLAFLGGVSLSEAAADDSKRLASAAMVRVLEGEDTLTAHDETLIADLATSAGLQPPAPINPTADELELVPNYDLNRIDPTSLDLEGVVYLTQRAMQISATLAGRRASLDLLAREVPTDGETAGVKILGYTFLMQHAANIPQAIKYAGEARQYAEANNMPTGSLLLTEAMLLAQSGDSQGFQATVQSVVQKYGNDPEIMGQLQEMLMQMGLIRPDGSPVNRGGPRPAGASPASLSPSAPAPASSGLWTPDAPAPAAGAAGGGKLWVPGMD